MTFFEFVQKVYANVLVNRFSMLNLSIEKAGLLENILFAMSIEIHRKVVRNFTRVRLRENW